VEHFAAHWLSQLGPFGLFALLMLGIFGLPIPDETILVLAGSMIRSGQLQAVPTAVAAMSGAMAGITISFVLGRVGGRALLTRPTFARFIHRSALDRTERWFQRVGKWLLMVGYFVPGVRHVTAIVAGVSGLSPRSFAAFASMGAGLWVSCFLWIGYALAKRWPMLRAALHAGTGIVLVIAVVGVTAYLWWRARKHADR